MARTKKETGISDLEIGSGLTIVDDTISSLKRPTADARANLFDDLEDGDKRSAEADAHDSPDVREKVEQSYLLFLQEVRHLLKCLRIHSQILFSFEYDTYRSPFPESMHLSIPEDQLLNLVFMEL